MRDWALVYQRPSFSIDAFLFVVAVGLHVPLILLHMEAPMKAKPGTKGRHVDIGFVERIQKKAEERKAKAMMPAKVSDAKKMEDAIKRAAEIRERLLKAAIPPPVIPKAQISPELKTIDASKIKMDLKKALEMKTQQLKSDKTFTDKKLELASLPKSEQIKIAGGGVTAINMGAKPGALPGAPGASGLKGKAGFAVSSKAMPVGIGGGDGDIKMSAGPAIVVPTSNHARADAGILSSVATVRDRGSLQGKGGVSGVGAGAGGPSGLALGPGGAGGSINVPGARSGGGPVAMGPTAVQSRSFSDKGAASSASPLGSGTSLSGSGLGSVAALPRRESRPTRSPFQISGPLANRPLLSKVIPDYPEWAKAKGVDASVVLRFTVTTDGQVRTAILIERTSGDLRLDQVAIDALRQWRFQPLPMDKNEDQVGSITFVFSIR